MIKIALAVVHGIGSHEVGYANTFCDSIRKEVQERTAKELNVQIEYKSIVWSQVLDSELEKGRDRILSTVKSLRWKGVRRKLIGEFSSAILYSRGDHQPLNDTRENIHLTIARQLKELCVSVGNDAPLFIVAHSLGTVIISDYLKRLQIANWDEPEKYRGSFEQLIENSRFLCGKTTTGLYFLGSPLPMWALANEDLKNPPDFPATNYFWKGKKVVPEWLNFYTSGDCIGYPLRPISQEYENSIDEDIFVRSLCPPWKASFLPTSHSTYWKIRSIKLRISRSLVNACNELNNNGL